MVVGKDEIRRQLQKYHDAIVYVHDAVVAGMNAGKDVHTLMQEIKLPPELDVGEGFAVGDGGFDFGVVVGVAAASVMAVILARRAWGLFDPASRRPRRPARACPENPPSSG